MDESEEFSSFASFSNDVWSFPEKETNNTSNEGESWNADFQSFEENESTATSSTINQSDCVASAPILKELLGKCFEHKNECFEDSLTTVQQRCFSISFSNLSILYIYVKLLMIKFIFHVIHNFLRPNLSTKFNKSWIGKI